MKRHLENDLKAWKSSPRRLPLLIRGARQVGKSYLVEKFGKKHFKNVALANLDYQPELGQCFTSKDPKKVIQQLEVMLNESIQPGKTLLFIDEIQNEPNAILVLRYFKEKLPELHVIAAGSLLEFVLNENRITFPVGRVESLYLKPFSFLEFLEAIDEVKALQTALAVTLENPPPGVIHEKLNELFKTFLLVGGMPEVVKTYRDTRSLSASQKSQEVLLQTYRSDFGKYATRSQHKYLKLLFSKAPHLIAKPFKYSQVDREIKSREIKTALQQLEWAQLFHRIKWTSGSGIPLEAQSKEEKFKLLFLDIGLLQKATHIDPQTLLLNDFQQINSGSLAEQITGQELLSYRKAHEAPYLHYWQREARNSQAEVDFVIQHNMSILPIEVKAGSTGRLKSLQTFLTEKKQILGIRISTSALTLNKNVLSVPFYLIGQLPVLVTQAQSSLKK